MQPSTWLGQLWETALRDHASVVSMYLVPESHQLQQAQVSGYETDSDSFSVALTNRLRLGRAVVVCQEINNFKNRFTESFQLERDVCTTNIRGTLDIPRLIVERSRGSFQIPIKRSLKNLSTPENLLAVEAICHCRNIARDWIERGRGRAEGKLARHLFNVYSQFLGESPWSDIQGQSGKSIRALSHSVVSRAGMKIIENSHPAVRIAKLFQNRIDRIDTLKCFEGLLNYQLSVEPHFEDKLFELVCLGWIIRGAYDLLTDIEIDANALIGGGGSPILVGFSSGHKVSVVFQSRVGVFEPHWKYVDSGRFLQGIPDLTLVIENPLGIRTEILVDAKNRGYSSESEVIYKLLGYMENFKLNRYRAVGIFPSDIDGVVSFKQLRNDDNCLTLLRTDLKEGQSAVKELFKNLLAEFSIFSSVS